MRLFIALILIIGIVLVVLCYADIEFNKSFWPNLWADLVVALIFGIILDQFTSLTKKPKLAMVIKQGTFYSDTIKWERAVDGQYETSFRIAIKNIGNKMLKPEEGYWHLYFPGAIEINHIGDADRFTSPDKEHIRDLIRLPIFPNSFLDIGPEFKMKTPNIATFPIHYFFATEYRNFPKSVRMNQETGEVPYNTMGTFPVEVV